MRSARTVFAGAVALLGLSCAAPLPRPPDSVIERQWQARMATLMPIQHWDLRARLAVRTDDHGGQASLQWIRDAAHHSIRLSGPLGRGLVRVTQDETGAQLQDDQQRVFYAPSAEALLFRYTGWRLPLTNLIFWVRGIPVPDVPVVRELDDNGRLMSLQQQGWRVEYQEYQRVDARDLPGRMTLTYTPVQAAPELPAMQVRLVVERWSQVQ